MRGVSFIVRRLEEIMAGVSQRFCPECGCGITKAIYGLYACDICPWRGNETAIYFTEFPDANSGECRRPIYQGTEK